MGQDFTMLASAWPVIRPAFERALGGETSYLENQRMFLDRNGYRKNLFHLLFAPSAMKRVAWVVCFIR